MVVNLVIPNAVQVKLKWTSQGIPWLNSLFCQYTIAGPLNPTVAETVFAALKGNAATTAWLTHCRPQTILTGIGIRDVRAPNNPEILSTGAVAPGTSGAGQMPLQVAIVVTLRTAFAGRQFRGRVYLGGIDTGSVVAATGLIDPVTNAAAVAFVQAAQTALGAQSMTLAIGQRLLPERPAKDGTTLPVRPANIVPVTSVLSLNQRFDTQRRRLQ